MKEQKTKKDEVSRGTSKAPEKVSEEVETLKNILSTLANNIQQHSALVHKLKYDAAIVGTFSKKINVCLTWVNYLFYLGD